MASPRVSSVSRAFQFFHLNPGRALARGFAVLLAAVSSAAAAVPFAWADMFTDFGFTAQYYVYARGEE